jgi:hypothetical protein
LDGYRFRINLDTSQFGVYTRQGLVENKKVAKVVSYDDLATSYRNPSKSGGGRLIEPDFKGRSIHLHLAVRAVHAF